MFKSMFVSKFICLFKKIVKSLNISEQRMNKEYEVSLNEPSNTPDIGTFFSHVKNANGGKHSI